MPTRVGRPSTTPSEPGQLRAAGPGHPPRRELATLALRHAGGPDRALLEWSERWRANALFQPAVQPPDDAELARDLAALRDTRRRLAEARAEGSPTAARLDEERARLEHAIRRRAHHLRGTSRDRLAFRAERARRRTGRHDFVESSTSRGRCTHWSPGPAGSATWSWARRRRRSRRSRSRGSRSADGPWTTLGPRRRRPPAAGGAAGGRRTPRSGTVPWSSLLLAGCTRLPGRWSRRWRTCRSAWRRRPPCGCAPGRRRTVGARVLIAGPGLESGGAELDTLALRHPGRRAEDGVATVERSLEALDGAAVAHVAAHGRFREDSPLFSSLDLDDGPLTVHDFERLAAPRTGSCCRRASRGWWRRSAPARCSGLVSAMLAMGSAGIVPASRRSTTRPPPS